MTELSLYALPSLMAAAIVPLIGLATLLIERGSRRGLGIAGFLLLFGAAEAAGVCVYLVPADADAPLRLSRLAFVLGGLAYIPMVEFLADLARRSGRASPLGIRLHVAEWLLRLTIGSVAVFVAISPVLIADMRFDPSVGWVRVFGPAWPGIAATGFLFMLWAFACWDGERRRTQKVSGDLLAWGAALLLLNGLPIFTSTLLPGLGIAETNFLNGISTLLGSIATILGLLLTRDLELRRLRAHGRRAPLAAEEQTRIGVLSGAPVVLCCSACSAQFRVLPDGGSCSLCQESVAPLPDPMIGRTVGDHLRVLSFIGAGSAARVYAAEHRRLGVRRAVKIPWADSLADRRVELRFHREGRATAELDSPHLVKMLELGELQPKLPYMVMELVEGQSLARLLRHAGPLDPLCVSLLGSQIARALETAHAAGVVHRDLKPANVVVVRTADRDVAKLVDFGIAKLLGTGQEDQLTATGAIAGTPSYISPEQISGEQVSGATDYYSLGVMLYEALVGRVPFRASRPGELFAMHLHGAPPPLPVEGPLADLVLGLLDKEPERRREHCRNLGDRLEVLAGEQRRFVPQA